MFLLLKKLTIL